MKQSISYLFALLVLCLLIPSLAFGALPPKLRPVHPDQFFITPNQPTTLQLAWLNLSTQGESSELSYQVYDYWHHLVTSGHTMSSTNNAVQITVNLARGFYTLTFPQLHQTLGMDAISPFTGKKDPFFSIDAAISAKVVPPSAHRRTGTYPASLVPVLRTSLVKILKRCGITAPRARMDWKRVNPKKGVWHWDTPFSYDKMRQKYRRANMKITEMFSWTPPYLQPIGNWRGLPGDLLGTAKAWSHLADRWADVWAAVEMWNEPATYGRAPFPADQWASMAKVLSYVLHQKDPSLLIGGPAMGGGVQIPSIDWAKDAAANGVLAAMNYWSYHSYAHAVSMQRQVKIWRKLMANFGRPHMPLWITESGRPWKMTSDNSRPAIKGGQASALDITMKAVETRACGISKYFAFLFLPAYHRGGHVNYGMMGIHLTPLRPMAAYAQAISTLAHHHYIGNLRVDNPAVLRARVFSKENQAVVVLYTGQTKQGANIPLNISFSAVRGIDGRLLPVNHKGTIPIPDGLSYVYTTTSAIGGLLQSHTEAMSLYQQIQTKPLPVQISPVVLQFAPNAKTVTPYQDGYWVKKKLSPDTFPVTVNVLNVGSRQRTVDVSLAEKTRSVSVGPMSKQAVTFRIDLPGLIKGATGLLKVTAGFQPTDRIKHLPDIEPLVIRLHRPTTITALLKQYPAHQKLPIHLLNRWQARHGKGVPTQFTWQNNLWKLTMQPRDHRSQWSFPGFLIKPENDRALSRITGIILRGRSRSALASAYLVRTPTVDNVEQYSCGQLFPNDGQWHVIFIPIDHFTNKNRDLAQTVHKLILRDTKSIRLRIGIAARGQTQPASLEISDLYLTY